MISLLKRKLGLVLKLCIGLLVAWTALMFVLFWLSGEKETQIAFATGKRFIVTITDGTVAGTEAATPESEAKAAAEKAAEAAIPLPAPEPVQADASTVTDVITSTNPINDISENMIDKVNGLSLPKVAESGERPMQYYAKNYRRQNELPIIAIMVTGLGQSKKITEMALALDDRISLSFSPYSPVAGSWAAASRLSGHELYLELPFQTTDYPDTDPGPYSMLLSRTQAENMKNLHWALSRFQGYAGVVAPIGEVITSNPDAYTPIAKELSSRGLMMMVGHLAGPPIENEDGSIRKLGYDITSTYADVWVDEELTEMSIQARLATLEQIAQRNGYAVGVAQAYPLSINEIKRWQQTLGERGIMIAPVSFIPKVMKH